MQIPLQITLRHMAYSNALETRIRADVANLEQFHRRVTSCRVTVSGSDKHRQQGREFEVRVELRVPGHGEIIATRKHDEDVYIALRDASKAATRQLEDLVREKRGDVKKHEPARQARVRP